MQRKTKKIIIVAVELIVIIALCVYFGFLVVADFDKFTSTFLRFTVPFLCGLLLFQIAIHGIGAFEWRTILKQAGSKQAVFTIFTARLTGFAISYLTPSLYLGGEPARAAVLNDVKLSYKKSLASVIVDKYIELFTKLPCIIAGFALLIVILKPELYMILISTLFIVGFIALFVFLLIKLFKDKAFINRFFKRLLRPFVKINPRAAVKAMLAIKEFQTDLSEIVKEKKAFYLASLLGFLISIVEVFQSYYIISFLYPAGYTHFMILMFSFIIFFSSLIFSLIPYPTVGGFGPVEGVCILFFLLFGMQQSDGLLYSFILRMGQLVAVGGGLVNLFLRRVFKKSVKNI
jgi:uncharacterized protein (TIRG00374 family)